MPKIIGLEEQQKAVRDITSALKDIETVNNFFATQNPSKEFTISFVGADGKRISTKFICEDRAVLDGCIKKYKESVARKMSALANENHIELETKEKEIFGL